MDGNFYVEDEVKLNRIVHECAWEDWNRTFLSSPDFSPLQNGYTYQDFRRDHYRDIIAARIVNWRVTDLIRTPPLKINCQ